MNTTENNKLIAEFMGYDYIKHGDISDGTSRSAEDYLEYDSSWDWLMAVVYKFRDLKIDTYHYWRILNALQHALMNSGISEVYKIMIEAVKWYNENKK